MWKFIDGPPECDLTAMGSIMIENQMVTEYRGTDGRRYLLREDGRWAVWDERAAAALPVKKPTA